MTPTKILDQIKVNIGDMCQDYLMNSFTFDIYFETWIPLDSDVIWRVHFYETGKEPEIQKLKEINIQTKRGPITLKLNVPPPNVEDKKVDSLVENGATIRVSCHFKDNVFYEVTYDYEIIKTSTKMPQDPFICLGLMPAQSPIQNYDGLSSYLIRDLKNEEIIEYDCNSIVQSKFTYTENDLKDVGSRAINLTALKNKTQHQMIKETLSRSINSRFSKDNN